MNDRKLVKYLVFCLFSAISLSSCLKPPGRISFEGKATDSSDSDLEGISDLGEEESGYEDKTPSKPDASKNPATDEPKSSDPDEQENKPDSTPKPEPTPTPTPTPTPKPETTAPLIKGFAKVNGTKIVDSEGKNLFLKGINLGNWLTWEGYLMMGEAVYMTHSQFFDRLAKAFNSSEKAAEFEYLWRLNYIDLKAIADLKNLGFNSVRVPFNYALFWRDGKLRDDGFIFFDKLINYCRTHGIYILLDMHGAPGYQNPGDHSDNGNSNKDQPRSSVTFWDGTENIEIASKIWKHIASRYKDEHVILGYDLINEPVTQDGRENEILPSFIKMRNAIREVDKNHLIVAEGSWWASDLSKLDWTNEEVRAKTGVTKAWDDKLVYQIHHYGPPADTFGREKLTNRLNIPLIIGEYGENEHLNELKSITDWAKSNLAGSYPWSFKKVTMGLTLWTIPTNNSFEKVKAFINKGTPLPAGTYEEMLEFARQNTRNGHSSHKWHQDFYDAIK